MNILKWIAAIMMVALAVYVGAIFIIVAADAVERRRRR